MDRSVRCVGCGGLVAEAEGSPVHPYMVASPGCWQRFGELSATAMDRFAGLIRTDLRVDAYAVQHPGNAEVDRRQRQSVAVHLIVLCLALEGRVAEQALNPLRARISDRGLARLGLAEWPHLAPPAFEGAVTVSGLAVPDTVAQYQELIFRWARSAWGAWEAHHPVIRGWAEVVAQR